jgi:hypothetical protein
MFCALVEEPNRGRFVHREGEAGRFTYEEGKAGRFTYLEAGRFTYEEPIRARQVSAFHFEV